jgi:hypothetical protein
MQLIRQFTLLVCSNFSYSEIILLYISSKYLPKVYQFVKLALCFNYVNYAKGLLAYLHIPKHAKKLQSGIS